MFSTHSVYIGKGEGAYSGFFNGSNFYLILQIDSDHGERDPATTLGQHIASQSVNNLADFENCVASGMRVLNLPAGSTVSAAYISQGILYLKTLGEGTVFLKKGKQMACVIKGNNGASGYIEEGDTVVLTTESFVNRLAVKDLYHISGEKIQNISNSITRHLKSDSGDVAFFIRFSHRQEVEKPHNLRSQRVQFLFSWLENLKLIKEERGSRRTLTIIVVALIGLLLIWSVLLGYGRRTEAEFQKKVNAAKELITQKLDQAEDVAFLNMARSQVLIAESRTELDKLQSAIGNRYKKEIKDLTDLISVKESKITKKEEKQANEFFDLTIEHKNSQGDKMAINDDRVVVLDKINENVYIISLTKKSLEKRSISRIKNPSFAALYNSNVYVYSSGNGIYEVSDTDNKKIIENDPEWKNIVDMVAYNGTLYLADAGQGQLYKYVASDEGFSAKIPYFKPSKTGLSDMRSIAIDGSIYINTKDEVYKYITGVSDTFTTEYPEAVGSVEKVITSVDLEKAYIWDKEKSAIYILAKDGVYERQLRSEFLAKASDVKVFGSSIYLLIKSKIYEISLE